jgi:SH3 domain-containing protein/peptidase C39-like protein
MAFNLVYLSQQDPQWKNDTLGFGDASDTIGYVGCALTSVAMLLSGYGLAETPKTLNQKLKAKQGFVSAGIRWDVVSQVYPQVKLKANIPCETTDAPLAQIDSALAAGQPVLVRVDASPNPGLQWHYVLLYARKGDDYLMLDPWPYRPGTTSEDLLMNRYSQGQPLKRSIQQVLLYEVASSGGPIATPASTTSTPAPAGGAYARVMDSVTWGLNIRSNTDTSSMANLVITVSAGTQLLVLDPDGAAKIGQSGQWVRVREPGGKIGFAAAWFLEKIPAAGPAQTTTPTPGPEKETPISVSTTSAPGPSSSSTPAPPSPATSAPATPAPTPTSSTPSTPAAPAPPMEETKLIVKVVEAVGTSGLRLRQSPSKGGALIMVLKAGTRLTVIEPAKKAKAKIGQANQWIYVREPNGNRGYVGAEYVKLA